MNWVTRILFLGFFSWVLPANIPYQVTEQFPLEISLFEHAHFKGREFTFGSDLSTCTTLTNTTKLCKWGDGRDCTLASKAVSSVRFNIGTCVNMYRDLYCFGVPSTLYNETGCSSNFDQDECRNELNDVVGSISSCAYGECQFLKMDIYEL